MTGHVLVLGGGGAVGRHAATRLAELGHAVTVVGRSPGPLEQVAASVKAVSVRVGDATDPAAFTGLAPDIVVNATGATDPSMLQPWLDAGRHVIDIAASGDEIAQLADLDTARASLILSVGLIPGLSTLMAAQLCSTGATGPLTIGALLGIGEDYGNASRRWTLSRLGRPAAAPDGTFRNFVPPVTVRFPAGFGVRRAWRFDFADQKVLHDTSGVTAITAYCLDSRLVTTALAAAARCPGAPQALLAAKPVSRWVARGRDWWALTVTDEAGHQMWALGRAQSRATGAVAALAAHRVLSNPPANGVHHLHELTTLDEALPWLGDHGIAVGGNAWNGVSERPA